MMIRQLKPQSDREKLEDLMSTAMEVVEACAETVYQEELGERVKQAVAKLNEQVKAIRLREDIDELMQANRDLVHAIETMREEWPQLPAGKALTLANIAVKNAKRFMG